MEQFPRRSWFLLVALLIGGTVSMTAQAEGYTALQYQIRFGGERQIEHNFLLLSKYRGWGLDDQSAPAVAHIYSTNPENPHLFNLGPVGATVRVVLPALVAGAGSIAVLSDYGDDDSDDVQPPTLPTQPSGNEQRRELLIRAAQIGLLVGGTVVQNFIDSQTDPDPVPVTTLTMP
ncbi:MAG: hypothetical protein SVU69_07710 [Pseudomonadota bacterium]|nr:hypothetical protein [Pseudomonadota bacterium]